MKEIKPRIINNHDYMSIVLGNRRLTVSWNGVKASGGVPNHVFQLFDQATAFKPEALAKIGITDKTDLKNGKVIQAFADHIDEIWPEWKVQAPRPKVGDRISYNFTKGLDEGTVYQVARSYVYAEFKNNGRIGVSVDLITIL